MGGGPADDAVDTRSISSEDLVNVSHRRRSMSGPNGSSSWAEVDQTVAEAGSQAGDTVDRNSERARLLWSKSKVYLHPTAYTRDNLPGFLSIVQLPPSPRSALADGTPRGEYLLAWIPEAAIEGTADWDQYVLVELGETAPAESVLVAPPAAPSPHGFSVPLVKLYSLVMQPPTLSAWFGSVTFHLFNAEDGEAPTAMPTLYFHDEESRSTILDRDRRVVQLGNGITSSGQTRRTGGSPALPSTTTPATPDPNGGYKSLPPSWGGESLLGALRQYTTLLRSRLEPKLFLVNPSRVDREVHETELFEDDAVPAEGRPGRESTKRTSILHRSLGDPTSNVGPGDEWPDEVPTAQMDSLTFSVLNGFSRFSRGARAAVQTATSTAQQTAQFALSHPLARPIAKYVPTPVAHFANAPGEIARATEIGGVDSYDSARVYLAKWARVVAEEGERARKAEVVFHGPGLRQEDSEVGAFEVLASTYSITRPLSTRAVNQPIAGSEWSSWFDDEGRLMIDAPEAKKRIFQRGLADDARRDVWPFLLEVYPWNSTTLQRQFLTKRYADEYERSKARWANDDALHATDRFAEESHRVEIDCRRTDRTHPMFVADENDPAPDDAHPRSNPHVLATQSILMTYVFAEDGRDGYVQGMSDLLSPVYVVMDGDEVLAFKAFECVMERQKGNFLRDQSGMMRQLTDLQSLIRKMDFQLYTHLEQTGSLNLFFCFRWILCAFKRELSFGQTLRLWEVLWTDHYSKSFHLFVALAIVEANRDVIIRYLREFDEVLKFFNELSQTLDIEAVLADAEVLYLAFAKVVESADKKAAELRDKEAVEGSSTEGLRRRKPAAEDAEPKKKEGEEAKNELGEGDGLLEAVEDVRTGEVPEIEANLRELLK